MSEDLIITATEASRSFSEMLHRVAYSGETFVIKKGNRIMARIMPVAMKAEESDVSQVASEPIKSLPPELIPDFSQNPTVDDAEYYQAMIEELSGQGA